MGNLISDFVKGKKKLEYPPGIQRGIALHRAIDGYTDGHAVTRRAKEVFRGEYGLYSGAIVDVVYDHFVANDAGLFPDEAALKDFSQRTYEQAAPWQDVFPERFVRMFHYMRSQDWLYHYRYKQGIYNSLAGLARRAAYMKEATAACRLFDERYPELGECYREFFPSLKEFAIATLERLRSEEK